MYEDCSKTLNQLANEAAIALYLGRLNGELERFQNAWSVLDLKHISRSDAEIRNTDFYASWNARETLKSKLIFWRQSQERVTINVREALASNASSATLLVHSHDGYVREEAVKVLDLRAPTAKAILLLRCNDWVAPIRKTALKRLRTAAPDWTPSDLSPLVSYVLGRKNQWARGGEKALKILLDHPAWNAAVHQTLLTQVNGPLAKVLRGLLKTDLHDGLLAELSQNAKSAQVRAVATQTVLEGCARWLVGTNWQWVDKTISLRRRVPSWDKRIVDRPVEELSAVFQSAAADPSVSVRKLAAEHLIRVGPQGSDRIIALLEQDRSKPVFERMDYYRRKWFGNRTEEMI